MMNIKSGDIVMFKEVKDKGDENAQMVVLDDYGKDCERCLVKYLNTGLPLPPPTSCTERGIENYI